MKQKIFAGLALLALFAGVVYRANATMGNATTTQLATKSPAYDQKFVFGTATGPTPTNTPSTDTSSTLSAAGYGTAQFVITKAGYWGAFKIQGSMDDSTYVDLLQDDTGEAVTETVYWECSEPWKNYKVVTLPSVNDTGTVVVTGNLLVKSTNHTGYYGPAMQSRELLASALRTTSTTTYFHVGSIDKGVVVRMNATASNSGSAVCTLYKVSPGGVLQKVGAAGAAITGAAQQTFVVSPDIFLNPVLATATPQPVNPNIYTEAGGYWCFKVVEGGTSTTYSVNITPLK